MKHKVEKQHRRSIRLKGYDYANSGAYFVTIVTQGRACLFGEIVNAETRLNDAGSVIERWWFELNNKFRTVETDDFVIMPNHFHGIVVIADVGADLCVGPVGKGIHAGVPPIDDADEHGSGRKSGHTPRPSGHTRRCAPTGDASRSAGRT